MISEVLEGFSDHSPCQRIYTTFKCQKSTICVLVAIQHSRRPTGSYKIPESGILATNGQTEPRMTSLRVVIQSSISARTISPSPKPAKMELIK